MKKLRLLLALGLILSMGAQAKTITLDYVYDPSVTAQDGDVITGTMLTSNLFQVRIADQATVTLKNVTINGVNSESYKWAGITCLGHATIVLEGENTVRGFHENYPGIQINSGKNLVINGSGVLHVSPYSQSAFAAGIGGKTDQICGNIKIDGGIIYAQGGLYAAAIGGGKNGDCGTIEITDYVLKLTATATSTSPVTIGHGGGTGAVCAGITIGGETITTDLTASPYTYVPAWNGNLATLTKDVCVVDGMTLTGTLAEAHRIIIDEGATITLSNADINRYANIGVGNYPGLACLGNAKIILKGTNYVTSYGIHPAIYVPTKYPVATLVIDEDSEGGTLYAQNILGGAGIGGGRDYDCGAIQILGGTIVATGSDGAGIGAGIGRNCGAISIQGGSIKATGNNGSAGIGGSKNGACSSIFITFSVTSLYAQGDAEACAIGPGKNGSCSGPIVVFGISYPVTTGLTTNPYKGEEVYSEYDDATKKLTYKYDDKWRSNGLAELYDPAKVRFKGCYSLVDTVIINPSMKDARLTSMKALFYGGKEGTTNYNLSKMTAIEGIENLYTTGVTNMDSMFYMCSKLTTLDFLAFSMTNVTTANDMFNGCQQLKTIYCNNDWNALTTLTASEGMFKNCTSLEGGAGTKYNVSNPVNKGLARPDEGATKKGYFTTLAQLKAPLDSAISELVLLYDEASARVSDFTTLGAAISAASSDAKTLKFKTDATVQEVFDGIDAAYAAIKTQGENFAAQLKSELISNLEALITTDDSDACKQIIANAKSKVNSDLAWDNTKSVALNITPIDVLRSYCKYTVPDALKVQRAKDELTPVVSEMEALYSFASEYMSTTDLASFNEQIKNAKAVLTSTTADESTVKSAITIAKGALSNAIAEFVPAAKTKLKAELDNILQSTDLRYCQDTIKAAKDEVDNLSWDNTKSVNENKTILTDKVNTIYSNAYAGVQAVREFAKTKPTNFRVTAKTPTSITVAWESTGTKWSLSWKEATETTYVSGAEPETKSYTITGLNPETTYDLNIASLAVPSSMLSESVTIQETTLAVPCDAPTNLQFERGTNMLSVTWESTGSQWEIEIRKASETAFSGHETLTNKTFAYTSLEPNTEYVVRVRTQCDLSHYSEWVEVTVSTLPLTPVSGCEFTGFYQDVNLLGATWNAASKALVEAAFTPATGAVYAIKAGSSVLYRTVGETMETVADGFVIVPGEYNYEVTVEITDSEYTFPDDMYTITATVDGVAWSIRGASISATENSIVIFSPMIEVKQTPSGLEQIIQSSNGKIMIDGKLYIIRDGVMYNAQGAKIEK